MLHCTNAGYCTAQRCVGGMKYEVIETGGEWIVQRDGVEMARFANQSAALDEVAARLRDAAPGEEAVSLRVSYQARG
ncbi:MAG: hypothetical protein JWP50_559 [Phenylobacterium sp.]|nr:hypothetical protein [Phenylobacterium sp.]